MPKPTPQIGQDSREGASENIVQTVVPFRLRMEKLLKGPRTKHILNLVREKFALGKKDLDAELDPAIADSLAQLFASGVEADDLVNDFFTSLNEGQSLDLLGLGVSNYLRSKFGLNWSSIPDETRLSVLSSTRELLLSNPRLNVKEALIMIPVVSDLVEESRLGRREVLIKNRANAVREMNAAFPFMSEWQALTEEQEGRLNEKYYTKRSEQQFVSTYFDSATFGLVDRQKEREVIRAGTRSHLDFDAHISGRKKAVLNAFDPAHSPSHSEYKEENLFFCSSASEAFRLFAETYLNSGEVVLVTEEEYKGMRNILDKRGIRVEMIPKSDSSEQFEESVLESIKEHKPKYILVSEVSRRGTIFPVDRIRELINACGQETHLIIDGTQTVGRKPIDFGASQPDAYFASCQKGSDYGGPSGILALSNGFVLRHGHKISSGEGTEDTVAIERFYRACDRNEILERQKRIRDLSLKFEQSIQEINKATENHIKILYPSFLPHAESSGIFELEIEGISRYEVNKFCRDYGVFVADHYLFPARRESFRIALHPCMSDDSIRILSYALYSLSEKAAARA